MGPLGVKGALVNSVLKQALDETVVAGCGLRSIVAKVEPETFQPLTLLRSECHRSDFSSFRHIDLVFDSSSFSYDNSTRPSPAGGSDTLTRNSATVTSAFATIQSRSAER